MKHARKDEKGTKWQIPDETPLAETSLYVPRKTSRNGAVVFNIAVFLTACAAVLLCSYLAFGCVTSVTLVVMLVVSAAAVSSFHIALAWERVVVLRLGKVHRIVGPGLYVTLPIIEHGTIRVDQRVIATPFGAEKTLTADLVPVSIDAVLYWIVRDAEEACTEVEDYFMAVTLLAQTAMREAVGRSSLAEVAIRRDQLDVEIKEDIEKEASGWGIDIVSVKVRDIVIPDELQEVMSLEARADRERNARMSVVGVERDLAEMLKEAAEIYGEPDAALKLRSMLMQYETVRNSGGSVVTVPSSLSDGFVEGGKIARKQ